METWHLDTAVVTVVYIVAFSALGLAVREDQRSGQLPNIYTSTITLSALVGFAIASLLGPSQYRIGAMATGVALFCGPWLVAHLISPSAIGFGDIKLSLGLGAHLGWVGNQAPATALMATFVVFAVQILVRGRPFSQTLPFGPALAAGALIGGVVDVIQPGWFT